MKSPSPVRWWLGAGWALRAKPGEGGWAGPCGVVLTRKEGLDLLSWALQGAGPGRALSPRAMCSDLRFQMMILAVVWKT